MKLSSENLVHFLPCCFYALPLFWSILKKVLLSLLPPGCLLFRKGGSAWNLTVHWRFPLHHSVYTDVYVCIQFLTFWIFAFKGIDKIKLYGRYLNHRSNPHVKGLCFLKIHLFFWPFCMGRKRWGLIQIIGVILMPEVLVIMERFSSAHRIIPFSNLSLEI